MKVYSVKKSPRFQDGVAVVYKKEEAVEYGIQFLSYDRWRDAEYGQYAETVDGFVTPVIKRNDKSDPTYIKTPTGCFAVNRPGTIFDTEEFHNRNSFTRKSRWNGKSKKLTANQVVFFDILSRTGNLDRAVTLAYPSIKRDLDRKLFLMELVCSKLFREFMGKFRDKFIAAGINEDMLVDKLAELIPRSSPGTFPALAKMAAAGLGVPEIFESEKQLPAGKSETPLFERAKSNAEDVEFEETEHLKLTAVR